MSKAWVRPGSGEIRYCWSGATPATPTTSKARRCAVGALGLDEPAAVAAEEAGGHAAVLEDRVVEVAEDRRLARQGPGERVMGAAPGLGLGGVAVGAGAEPT